MDQTAVFVSIVLALLILLVYVHQYYNKQSAASFAEPDSVTFIQPYYVKPKSKTVKPTDAVSDETNAIRQSMMDLRGNIEKEPADPITDEISAFMDPDIAAEKAYKLESNWSISSAPLEALKSTRNRSEAMRSSGVETSYEQEWMQGSNEQTNRPFRKNMAATAASKNMISI